MVVKLTIFNKNVFDIRIHFLLKYLTQINILQRNIILEKPRTTFWQASWYTNFKWKGGDHTRSDPLPKLHHCLKYIKCMF